MLQVRTMDTVERTTCQETNRTGDLKKSSTREGMEWGKG